MYYFYPRSPCGERLFLLFRLVAGFLFLSTLSLRRATALSLPFGAVWIISIHALLAESDNKNLLLKRSRFIFLSTLSLRRATFFWVSADLMRMISIHALLAESDRRHRGNDRCPIHFYPRSPCGERRINRNIANGERKFLSTLSLRRATLPGKISENQHKHFYPRSPCGERPLRKYLAIPGNAISIHALLAESDLGKINSR